MKNWSSQLFPVIFLVLLAGLSFWLQKSVEHDEPKSDGKLRHDADANAEQFVVRRFDANGQLKYRLSAPSLVHYADDDSSLMTSPILVSYSPDSAPVTVVGEHAKISAKGEVVFLWDNVVLTRAAMPDRAEMIAKMQDLTTRPDAGFAFTNSPVEINQGQSWIKGIGAEMNNKLSTLVLQSQVTGLYIRPRATP